MTSQPFTNSTASNTNTRKPSLLRTALRVDSFVSGLAGAGLLALTSAFIDLTGIDNQGLLTVVGLSFILWAALLMAISLRHEIPVRVVRAIAIGNIVWALGSWALAIADPLNLTVAGGWVILLQGDLVLGFGIAQWIGLRRLEKNRG